MRKAYDLLRAEKEKADRRIVELEAQIAAMFDRAEIEVNARKAAEARCQQLEEALDDVCEANLAAMNDTLMSAEIETAWIEATEAAEALLRKGE